MHPRRAERAARRTSWSNPDPSPMRARTMPRRTASVSEERLRSWSPGHSREHSCRSSRPVTHVAQSERDRTLVAIMPHESGSSSPASVARTALSYGPVGERRPPRVGAHAARPNAAPDRRHALEIVEPDGRHITHEGAPGVGCRGAYGARVDSRRSGLDGSVEGVARVAAEVGAFGGSVGGSAPKLSGTQRTRVPVQLDERRVEIMRREPSSEAGVVDWLDVHPNAYPPELILHQHRRAPAGVRGGRNEQRKAERDSVAIAVGGAWCQSPAGAVEQRRGGADVERRE